MRNLVLAGGVTLLAIVLILVLLAQLVEPPREKEPGSTAPGTVEIPVEPAA